MSPSRTWPRRLAIPLLTVAAVAALAVVVTLEQGQEEPSSLDDFCGPPEVMTELPTVVPDTDPVTVGFEGLGDVEGAVGMTEAGPGVMLVVARPGQLYRVVKGARPALVLDLTGEITDESLEQGLLGVAVAPDGAHVYVHGTFRDSTARVVEYAWEGLLLDATTRRDVLVLDDPAPTHNGGRIAFGQDGLLYIGIGDGGNGAVTGAAQDLGEPFGKILRIDPRASGDESYTIPEDNPFVGEAEHRGETWAYGFRNPWGWSIDRATGDLWVGDVGQLCFEEIDFAVDGGRGVNFGWSFDEGAHEFNGPALGVGGSPAPETPIADLGSRPDELQGPVLEYLHSPGACAVIGGFVYRGTVIPDLEGTYLYADMCRRAIFTLRPDDDGWQQGQLAGEIPGGIVAFGEGIDGELYAVSNTDGIFRLLAADRSVAAQP